jgi:putative lexA repressor|nr:MAG TPA: Repressor protein CI [Caudoviricetes sp.]
MNKIEEVSLEIKRRREELGLYQEDVVDKLKKEGIDISISGLSRIESKERQKIDTALLIALSKILKKDFIKMLGHESEKEPSNVTDEVFESFVTIPLYGMASAGNGLIESEESNIEYINIPKLNGNVKKSDFATRVKGDSMEPYYHNGDIIVVDVSNQDIRTLNGKEALIYYDDNKYLKLVYFEPGTGNLFLRSYNVAYSDIKVENREVETLSCKGTVSMVISMRNRKMI